MLLLLLLLDQWFVLLLPSALGTMGFLHKLVNFFHPTKNSFRIKKKQFPDHPPNCYHHCIFKEVDVYCLFSLPIFEVSTFKKSTHTESQHCPTLRVYNSRGVFFVTQPTLNPEPDRTNTWDVPVVAPGMAPLRVASIRHGSKMVITTSGWINFLLLVKFEARHDLWHEL